MTPSTFTQALGEKSEYGPLFFQEHCLHGNDIARSVGQCDNVHIIAYSSSASLSGVITV